MTFLHRESGLFVWRGGYETKDLPKAAGFRWNPDKRYWWTDNLDKAAKLVSYADDDARAILISYTAQHVAALAESKATSVEGVVIPAPDGLDYLPFQRAGIVYSLKRPSTLIGDEMGLGKTIQAIGVINAMDSIKTVLVVCPASLKLNWQREMEKWLVRQYSIGIVSTKVPFPNTDIVIVNYDILGKFIDQLRSKTWDLLVADEANKVKNTKAQRTQFLLGVDKKKGQDGVQPIQAQRKLFLTGTPILNKPIELWPLLHALAPNDFPSFFKYAMRYCNGHQVNIGRKMVWDFSGASNLEELQDKLRATLMVRRLKRDVLKELPAKRRQIIEIDTNGASDIVSEEARLIARHEATLTVLQANVELSKASDNPQDYIDAVNALEEGYKVAFEDTSDVRHQVALAKLPYVIEHVNDAVENEEKVVVFAHHKDVARTIAQEFGTSAVIVTGDTKIVDRQAAVDRFQTDPNCVVFVGTIGAAGVGLTLTASSHVVFAELAWVPGDMSQAEDRCVLEGEPILTTSGWKPIEDVSVGESVIGEDGLPHKVIDSWNRLAYGAYIKDRKTIVEISVRGWNKPIKVTADHRVLTKKGWVEAGNLRPSDRIIMPKPYDGIPQDSITFDSDCRLKRTFSGGNHEMFGDFYQDRRVKPMSSQTNGRLIQMPDRIPLTEESMFVFGYYIGDGWAVTSGVGKSRSVNFAGNKSKKASSLKRCADWLSSLGVNYRFSEDKDGEGRSLCGYSGELALWISKQFGRVLDVKSVPEWVYSLDKKLRMSFLEGLLASDGYIRKDRYSFITSKYRITADATRLMLGLGLKPCVTYGEQSGSYSVEFTKGQEQSLIVSSVLLRNPTKKERVYDITVEDSETFVVGTAVVHNCHRIGQTDSVLVQHIVLANSLDAHMAQTIVDKQDVIDRALDKEYVLTTLPGVSSMIGKNDKKASRGDAYDGATTATSNVTQKQLSELPVLPKQQVEAIHSALKMLSAFCDGARSLDGMGFSKVDVRIGHSLADSPFLTNKQAHLGLKIIRKYVRQIPEDLLAVATGNGA